jgi:hypothetical protein
MDSAPTTSLSPEKGKLETVTVQFWSEDLAQLARLVATGGNRESNAYMRRIALHIGTSVLSLSIRTLLDRSEPIGMFTVDQIAKDILPRLDPAIQALVRLGYPVQVLPIEVLSLLQSITRQGPTVLAEHGASTSQTGQQGVVAVGNDERLVQEHIGERVIPSPEAMHRMGLDEDEPI